MDLITIDLYIADYTHIFYYISCVPCYHTSYVFIAIVRDDVVSKKPLDVNIVMQNSLLRWFQVQVQRPINLLTIVALRTICDVRSFSTTLLA